MENNIPRIAVKEPEIVVVARIILKELKKQYKGNGELLLTYHKAIVLYTPDIEDSLIPITAKEVVKEHNINMATLHNNNKYTFIIESNNHE